MLTPWVVVLHAMSLHQPQSIDFKLCKELISPEHCAFSSPGNKSSTEGRRRDGCRERQRQIFHWLAHCSDACGIPRPGWCQDSGAPSRFLVWAAGVQSLGLSFTASQDAVVGSWIGSSTTGTPMWDAAFPSSSFTCSGTMPLQIHLLL